MDEQVVRYICIKTFKYGNKTYTPGMVFIPKGGKFDDQILESKNLVRRDNSAFMNRARGRGKGATTNEPPKSSTSRTKKSRVPVDEPGELDGGADQ